MTKTVNSLFYTCGLCVIIAFFASAIFMKMHCEFDRFDLTFNQNAD